jgi:hypothetical protein
MFAFQERLYEHLGVLPALVLYTSDQPIDIPETRAMINRSESIKNFKDLK